MTNDYAPRQFLRQVRNALLREYFTHRNVLGEVDWDNLKETEVEPLYEKWRDLPELVRKGIESDFRSIHAMGVPDGTRALIEEGCFHQLDLAQDLDRLDGHLNKAFWVFVHHNQIFEVAARLHRADHLSDRYWRKRKDIPKKQPDVSPGALDELANTIAAYYWEHQGRGSPCRAEAYLRAGRYHYVFVYPKDYSDTFIGYDDNGRFERRPQNPAFEVIYVYDPEDGTLELYVRGDKKIVGDLQELFGRAILHEELSQEVRNAVTYELEGLKRRDFSFPTDPADRVQEVKVSALKVSLVGNHSVVIRMTFENTDGHGRPSKALSFRVSHPNSCNLKDSPEELIAKKYLKEWKIERA